MPVGKQQPLSRKRLESYLHSCTSIGTLIVRTYSHITLDGVALLYIAIVYSAIRFYMSYSCMHAHRTTDARASKHACMRGYLLNYIHTDMQHALRSLS